MGVYVVDGGDLDWMILLFQLLGVFCVLCRIVRFVFEFVCCMFYLVFFQYRVWFLFFLIVRMVCCGMVYCERGLDDVVWIERVNEVFYFRIFFVLFCWEQGVGQFGRSWSFLKGREEWFLGDYSEELCYDRFGKLDYVDKKGKDSCDIQEIVFVVLLQKVQ